MSEYKSINKQVLTDLNLYANAGGKAILIGEHSVVYGHKAISLALPDIRLNMQICPDKFTESWEDSWETRIKGNIYQTNKEIQKLLTLAFEKALQLCHPSLELKHFFPQKIIIQSEIPLGGGMGGSAAISTCLVKLSIEIAKHKRLLNQEISNETQIQFSNAVDCLFHSGKASGLDVTTVACDGLIEFSKDNGFKYIKNAKEFWLALVDTKERSDTASMVKKVADFLKINPDNGKKYLDNLSKLTDSTLVFLKEGRLLDIASNLNCAQLFLEKLGVSTKKIADLIKTLQSNGALAAKLTGAGGGGLVLALFEKKPEHLYNIFSEDVLYITKVPIYEEQY